MKNLGSVSTPKDIATKEYVDNTINSLLDIFYPIGSYYETSNTSFDPNTAWGGTWIEDTSGRVLVGAGTNESVDYITGVTGGNKDAIVPYHRHSVSKFNTGNKGSTITGYNTTRFSLNQTGSSGYALSYSVGARGVDITVTAHNHEVVAHNTNYEGTSGNATDANMQPYIVVKRWHRTA